MLFRNHVKLKTETYLAVTPLVLRGAGRRPFFFFESRTFVIRVPVLINTIIAPTNKH